MTQERELIFWQRPSEYTALDFAVIALLEDLKHSVVLPKIATWVKLFDNDRSNTDEDIRRQQNLVSGLVSVWDLLNLTRDQEKQKRALERYVWDNEWFDGRELQQLLKRNGHYLFNSYYYTLIREFGQEGLVPAIPGETQPSSSESKSHLRSFIQRNELPLHINELYLDTYATLNLPLRAGITPRYIQSYYAGDESSPKSWLVKNFLGDLAILEKREDYVHRHLCALISVLGDREFPQGAFVLTCAIPGELDFEDQKALEDVIQASWNAAPLSEIHLGINRTIRSICAHLDWASQDEHSITAPEETQQLEKHVQQALAAVAPNGTYVLRGAFYDADRRICELGALNSEGFQRVLDCQFPTSAWLTPDLVNREGVDPSELSIDTSKLKLLCELLEVLSSPVEMADVRKQAFADLLEIGSWRGIAKAILPEVGDELQQLLIPEVHSLKAENDRQYGRILLFHSGLENNSNRTDSLEEFKLHVRKALAQPELPGGTNSILARLQRIWNESHGAPIEDLAGENPLIESLLSCLGRVFEDSRTRAVLLLLDCATYIPEFVDVEEPETEAKKRDEFRKAFCAYPCFWMFETLCHSFTEDIEISCLTDDRNLSSLPFRWISGDRGYAVTRSFNERNDRTVATTFAYLGIPVSNWNPPVNNLPSEKEGWRIPDDEGMLQRWLNDRYREYLRDRLKAGQRDQSISRAMGETTAIKIDSIEISSVNRDRLKMDVILRGVQKPEEVVWNRIPTVDLAFCACSVEYLSRKHGQVTSARDTTAETELTIEMLQADGNTEFVSVQEDAKQPFQGLYRALWERSQTLRWGFQAGLSNKFILFNHEARTGLDMINHLFELTLEEGSISKNVVEDIETAKLGAYLLELGFGAVLGWPTTTPLLKTNPQSDPVRYLREVVDLAVSRGTFEVVANKLDPKITVATARLLLPKLKDAIWSSSPRQPIGMTMVATGLQKWRAQETMVVAISNSIKHQVLYLLRRLGTAEEVTKLPQDFWNRILRVHMEDKRLTVENIGPPQSRDFFREMFIDRKGKENRLGTYEVLRAAVKDPDVWEKPGEVVIDVGEVDKSTFESINRSQRELLENSHRYIVTIHLPTPFFEES